LTIGFGSAFIKGLHRQIGEAATLT